MQVAKRCVSRKEAAAYLGVSLPVLDWMIQTGKLPEVKLPVERNRVSHFGQEGVNRRVLIDIKDLDAIVESSKATRGN